MGLFSRKKRREIAQREQEALSRAGSDYDPMDAIPHPSPGSEARADEKGIIQVRMELPPKPGIGEFLARHLGMRRSFHLQLDERGSFFWNQIDGEINLKEIEKRLRKQFKLKHEEALKATVIFTKMLMARYVIQLEIPGMEQPAQSGDNKQ
jgi:hypothetical protein